MGKVFAPGDVLTASDTNTFLQAVSLQIPSSVSGTGVSFDTATGLVTFTNSPSVSVNGVFTSAYRHYRIIFDVTSAANTCGLRLRAAGTDDTTSNYDRQTLQGTGATAAAASATGQNLWGAMLVLSAAHTQGSSDYIFYNPALSVATRVTGICFSADGTTAVADAAIGARHRSASSFDGITLVPGSGNITGTMKVYGWA